MFFFNQFYFHLMQISNLRCIFLFETLKWNDQKNKKKYFLFNVFFFFVDEIFCHYKYLELQ